MSSTEPIFPPSLIGEIFPCGAGENERTLFSAKVELYMKDLVSHLITYKAQNRIIRESVVAVAPDSQISQGSGSITTRDACRTIRGFVGISLPDVTSIVKLPVQATVEIAAAPPMTPTASMVGVFELTSQSPSLHGILPEEEVGSSSIGVGVGVLKNIKEKKRPVSIASQLPPKVPKKRGRPSNKDRGLA
jgi:hypothetical protein